MALQQIDYSSFKDVQARSNELSKNAHWTSTFTGGVLKGIDVGMDMKEHQADMQKHRSDMKAAERKGVLDDWKMKNAKELADLDLKKAQEAGKTAELNRQTAEFKLKTAQKEWDKKFGDLAHEEAFTARDYTDAVNMLSGSKKALEEAKDEEARKLVIQGHNKLRESSRLMRFLYPDNLEDTEAGLEELEHRLTTIMNYAEQSKKGYRVKNDRGGYDGFDKDGNWTEVMTPDEVRKSQFSPSPSKDVTKIDEWKKPAKLWMEDYIKQSNIDIDFGDFPVGNIYKEMAADVIGQMDEYDEKNMESPSLTEMWQNAFDKQVPREKLQMVRQKNGVTYYKYMPNAAIEPAVLYKNGHAFDVEIIGVETSGQHKGKIKIRSIVPETGKPGFLYLTEEQLRDSRAKQ